MTRPATSRPAERGHVLVTTSLLLVPLLLFCALAVDVGSWYARAAEIQRVADAAALSGVEYMPDTAYLATSRAHQTAAINGFRHGHDGITIDVRTVPGKPHDLRVTITDRSVPTFFGRIVTDSISISRTAQASHLTPIQLGGTTNFRGGGDVVTAASPVPSDQAWLAINGACMHREHGDPHSTLFTTTTNCRTGAANPTYRDTGYDVGIYLPPGRTEDTEVVVYDGTGDYWSAGNPGDGDAAPGPRFPTGVDALAPTLFTLYEVDVSPTDDNLPWPMERWNRCRASTPDTDGTVRFDPWQYQSYRGDPPKRSNWAYRGTGLDTTKRGYWRICTIPSTLPSGVYRLRVTNVANDPDMIPLIGAEHSDITNNFGVFAIPATTHRLCSTKTDPQCPAVFGMDELSIGSLMDSDGTTEVDLARIDVSYAGRTVDFSVFDLEAGQTVQLLAPTGPASWAPATFDWRSTSGASQQSVSSVRSTASFNAHTVTMTVVLPPDYDPGTNPWWRVRYISTFRADRTTWSVHTSTRPLHLVPE